MAETTQTSSSAPRSRLRTTFRALRHRNYKLFFSGQLISVIGTWMQMVAQSWLVYRLTGSSVLLGSITFVQQFPVFVFATLGGMVADRHNRHRVVIYTQTSAMLLAFILSWLTLSGRVRIWEIFVLASFLGVTNAFDFAARQAFVVEMVGKEDLMNAIALNSSLFNGARIVGPAVAGILVASIGEGWCFFANGVSYVAVVVGLLMMRLEPWVSHAKRESPLEDLKEGFFWVRRSRAVRDLLLMLGLVSLVGMPYVVLMPIFADRVLHGGPRALGILMCSSGAGALVASLGMAMRKRLRGLGRWVATASAGFGLSMILFSWSQWFWLSVALLFPLGFFMMMQMACSNTLIQAMVPNRLRGRVMAFYSMMFVGMAPLGAFGAGAVATHIGAPRTLMVGGIACMFGSAIFGVRLPGLRASTRRLLVAQQATGGDPSEEVTLPTR